MKKITSPYLVNLNSLIDGENVFKYSLNTTFFEQYNFGEIQAGDFSIEVNFVKSSARILVLLNINGYAKTLCDKCVASIEIPMKGQFKYTLRKVESGESEDQFSDDEFITINENNLIFDTAPMMYENIHLLLPIQRTACEDRNGNKQCDEQALQKLNLSNITATETTQTTIDPRWAELLKLKNNK